MIHVREAHGTDYLCHSLFAGPVFGSAEKFIYNFRVVDKIHESETRLFLFGTSVGHVIYDSHDFSCRFAVAISHESLRTAKIKRRVFLR